MSRIQSAPFSDLSDLCQNWIALYEVSRLEDDGQCLAKIRVQLDPEEVALAVRYYLDPGSLGQIKLPCTIRSDIMAFTISRTVFLLSSTSTPRQCVSRKISLSAIPNLGFEFRPSLSRSKSSLGVFFAPHERYLT